MANVDSYITNGTTLEDCLLSTELKKFIMQHSKVLLKYEQVKPVTDYMLQHIIVHVPIVPGFISEEMGKEFLDYICGKKYNVRVYDTLRDEWDELVKYIKDWSAKIVGHKEYILVYDDPK